MRLTETEKQQLLASIGVETAVSAVSRSAEHARHGRGYNGDSIKDPATTEKSGPEAVFAPTLLSFSEYCRWNEQITALFPQTKPVAFDGKFWRL